MAQQQIKSQHRGRKLALRLTLIAAAIAVCIPAAMQLTEELIPIITDLVRGQSPEILKEELRSLGWEGMIIMVLLQMVQTLTILLPAMLVWITSGITYGFLGVVLCLTGSGLANTLTFSFSKKYGVKIVGKIIGKKRIENNFLTRSKFPSVLVALVYLVPGMPLGLIPYLAGVTNMNLKQFLRASIPAQIPNMLCFVYMGDKLIAGDYLFAIILFACQITLTLICFLFRKKILAFVERKADAYKTKKAGKQKQQQRTR